MSKTTTGEVKYAALYCRVSTTDQGERFSLPSQLKRLHEMAAGDGYTVKPEHVFVDQFSGKTATRPAFERLRALVKTGAIQAVLVLSVDRFARRVEDAAATFAEFKRHNVLLDFAEMRMEDSASSRFMFNTMCSMAEYMGEKILIDSARGRKQKLEGGRLVNGSAKFGYAYIPKSVKDGARLEIDPIKAEIVRDIFRWRLEGMSMYGIAKRLNEAGILSKGYNGKAGGRWSKTVIVQMLRSRTYIGQHVCSGIVVPCPRIIDDETFHAVQKRRDADYQRLVGRPSNKYLLRRFLWCGKCTRRCIRSGENGRKGCLKRIYYRCGNIEYKPFKRRCDALGVEVNLIESAAWDAIWARLKNPALLLSLGQAYYDGLPKPEGDAAHALEREAARLTQRIKTTRQMMRDSAIDYAEGLTAIRQDETRIRQIEEELRAAGSVVSLPPLHVAEAAVREIVTGPEPKTYERKRDILEGILDLRLNYFDGDLEITGKVPMPAVALPADGKKNRYSGQYCDLQFHGLDPASILARDRSAVAGQARMAHPPG
jgi:site-specific DNA recombinase